MKVRLLLGSAVLFLSCLSFGQTYTFRMLSTFNSTKGPYDPSFLIIDSQGNLYGTSTRGGSASSGTIFKITPKGVAVVLYTFSPNLNETMGPGTGLVNPTSLTRDSKGNLFGAMPYLAGCEDASPCYPTGVFELKAGQKTLTTLITDWASPQILALDAADNVYAMDCGFEGDSNGCDATLFEIPKGGIYTPLYQWSQDNGGLVEVGNLVVRNGTVYGTDDGYFFTEPNNGEVFEWSPVSGFSVLHSFSGTDGAIPQALRQDNAGNLYGVTQVGGLFNQGTVFKLTPSGVLTTLYNFCSQPNCTDGAQPVNLTFDTAGNLYGVTLGGGAGGLNSPGVAFKLTPAGVESVLYSFTQAVNFNLAIDRTGNLYGTTSGITAGVTGGLNGVWKLTK